MRTIFIGSIALLYACKQNNVQVVRDFEKNIPRVFTIKNSKNITVKNDTVFLNAKKYSGYLFELHANNIDTFSIQAYFNGLQNGTEKKWFPNGKEMESREYQQGKKQGRQIAFWENGNKKFQFTAKDDAYEGELKEWNMDGTLIHLANYKNGQEEGTQKLWYNNGKIRANYVIINGRRYGLLGTKNCINVSDSIFITR